MAEEYYFKQFQDYLKDLCVRHVDVLHDDQTRKAFVKFQSDGAIQSIPNNAGAVIVVVANFTGRAAGSFEENKIQQTATLVFGVNVSSTAGNPDAAIEAAQMKAMGIMFDFYARMKHDMLEDDCGPLRYLQPEAMTFYPIDGPIIENYFGWELNLPFDSKAPDYNPAKFN